MPITNSPESILASALAQNRSSVLPNRLASDCNSADVIDCMIRASQNVFRLICKLDLIEPIVSTGYAVDRLDLSGVVCISGAKNVTVAVNATKEFCQQAYTSMTDDDCATAEDLHDTLGELANQLVGSAKEMLPLGGLQLGLPTIVFGAGHHIAFASDMTQHVIQFNGVDGLRIEVGIGS